jgi:hypothetical protein
MTTPIPNTPHVIQSICILGLRSQPAGKFSMAKPTNLRKLSKTIVCFLFVGGLPPVKLTEIQAIARTLLK